MTGSTPSMLPMRGREAELTLARAALAHLRRGAGSMLLIEGPPGIGKSRFLDEVLDRGARAGSRVLSARAFEDQQTVPLGPLFTAVLRSDPPIIDVETLRRPGTGADLRAWVVSDLMPAIAAATVRAPLVIAVDDMHWADDGSVHALRVLMEGLADAAMLWVLTMRSGAGSVAARDAIAAMSDHQRVRHLRLGAITREAAADIARDTLRADIDKTLLRLIDMAHGSPFLVLELIRGLREEERIHIHGGHVVVSGHTIPERMTVTMEYRLARLPEDTREMVQVAAILPETFSVTQLSRVLRRGPTGLLSSIADAVRADLLIDGGGYHRFRHDILRHAVRQSIPLTLRHALEREAAEILLDMGAAPEEVASQVARSATVGDRAAVDILRRASRSLSRSDPSAAADLVLRALELFGPEDCERSALVAEIVFLLNQAARYEEAQRLAMTALSSSLSNDEEALIRLNLSMAVAQGAGTRAEENLRSLRMPNVSSSVRAQHMAWLAYNQGVDGQTHASRASALTAMGALGGADEPYVAVLADVALANADCAQGFGTRALQRIEECRSYVKATGPSTLEPVVLWTHGNILTTLGLTDEAAPILSDGLELADRNGDPATKYVFTQLEALRLWASGSLLAARHLLDPPPDDAEFLTGESTAESIRMVLLTEIAARTDDHFLFRTTGALTRLAMTGGPARRRVGAAAVAGYAWAQGDLTRAVRLFGGCSDLLGTPLLAVDLDHVVLAGRVSRAAADAGLRERVMSAVEALEHETEPMPILPAVALHARGLLEQDLDAVEAAVRMLAVGERPLLYASAVEDSGRQMLTRGLETDSATRLSTAFDVFTKHGAVADARRIARLLQTLGVERRVGRAQRRTGWRSLTLSEFRVVDLVIDGASNRTVAERLGVSPHTVNSHLRSVYTKLGVGSRVQLTTRARNDGVFGERSVTS